MKGGCESFYEAGTDYHMFWACKAVRRVSDIVIGTGVNVDEMYIRRITLTMFLCDSKQIYRSDQSFEKYKFVKSEISLH